jgi:benzoylformate decarboxylase
MDLPGLDIVSLAEGFGCRAAHAETADDLRTQFKLAVEQEGPTVIVVPTQPQYAKLG